MRNPQTELNRDEKGGKRMEVKRKDNKHHSPESFMEKATIDLSYKG